MQRSKLALASLLLALAGCSPSEQATAPLQPVADNPFKLSGDVKHIMQWVLDPAADAVWDSAGSIITAAGTRELAPTTDAGWHQPPTRAGWPLSTTPLSSPLVVTYY